MNSLKPIRLPIIDVVRLVLNIVLILLVTSLLGAKITELFEDELGKALLVGAFQDAMFLLVGFNLYKLRGLPSINPILMRRRDVILAGFFSFLKVIFVLFFVNFFWMNVLVFAQSHNVIIPLEEQYIVQLLRHGQYNPSTLFGFILLVSVLVPVVEEFLFRNLLYRILASYFTRLDAMLLSSLLFAVLHFNILAFLGLWVMGILLVKIYEKYQNLWPCIIVHGLFNLMNVVATLVVENEGII